MNSCNFIDNVAAYALGSLDGAEKEQFERHLTGCLSCQAELQAYQSVMADLAQAVPQATPPESLRAQILRSATARQAAQTAVFQPSWVARLRQALQARQPALTIAGAVLIALLIFSNVFLLAQNSRLQQTQSSAFSTVVLRSPDLTKSASAVMLISDDGQFGTMVVDNLVALSDQQVYQLWLIKNGARTNGGVFTVNPDGYGWLKIEGKGSLLNFQSFGVTIEPKGGSLGPTGPKVLGGNLS